MVFGLRLLPVIGFSSVVGSSRIYLLSYSIATGARVVSIPIAGYTSAISPLVALFLLVVIFFLLMVPTLVLGCFALVLPLVFYLLFILAIPLGL